MEEHQNVSPSTFPSELNRSYYTGNSLSALHSSQQVHDGTVSTSVHPRASTKRINDTTPSCSALGSQLLHGNIGSPVLAGPTRNVTGEAMPTSLAEALTQLSFLEFVQRCNVLAAPSQSTQLPASVSLLDAAVQTTSPCEIPLRMLPPRRRISMSPRDLLMWQCRRLSTVFTPHLWTLPCRRSHTVLFLRTFLRRWVLAQLPRFLLIRQCRLLFAVWCSMMLPHNYRSRSSSLAVFTRTVLWTAKTLFVSLRHQCRIHICYLRHRPDSNSQSLPLSLLLIRTCSPMLAALPAIPAVACQYHTCGNTPCKHSLQRQEECQHRPRENPQPYWLQSSCRCTPLLQTKGSDSSYGQFWATQVQWTRPHCHSRQRSHAPSIPPFPSSVESRPGAKKSYQHCLRCLWKVPCGYSSGSQ